MHSLDDVSTIIKYTPDILCVDGTSKMRVTIVFTVSASGADALKKSKSRSLLARERMKIEKDK